MAEAIRNGASRSTSSVGSVHRRVFMRQAGAIGVAISTLPSAAALAPPAAAKRRLAMVGTGQRGVGSWGAPVVASYAELVEFVALCDVNPERAAVARGMIGTDAPTFTDFDAMVREAKPDTVIVTTIDSRHAEYVCRALRLGCDVICEKPLCTTARQAQDILDAHKQTGRQLTVTFNGRHDAGAMKVKELLLAGEVGEILQVTYDEFLDRRHGADYFRRWHAFAENSGTLLCHKSSHQFDQLNWWLDAAPVEVTAHGRLAVYGHNGPFRHTTCRACTFKQRCEFAWDITRDERLTKLYVECEDQDGYFRDACVYRNGIDIHDTAVVQIRYDSGALVNYSLNAAAPCEGEMLVINGTRGRIEMRNFDRQPWKPAADIEIRVIPTAGASRVIPIDTDDEDHGGADVRLRDAIFRPGAADPLGQRAGVRAGVMSSLIGIAAVNSMGERRPVRIADLVAW